MLIKSYPVTRWLVLATIIVPLLFNIIAPGYQNYLLLKSASPYIIQYHQYYRYVTFQLVSSGLEGDICLMVLLLFLFKNLERAMGKLKYATVVFGLFFYNFLITGLLCHYGLVVEVLMQKFNYQNKTGHEYNDEYGVGLPSGLLCCIVGLFHFYKKYVPLKFKFTFKLSSNGVFKMASTSGNSATEDTSAGRRLGIEDTPVGEESNTSPKQKQVGHSINRNEIVFSDQFFINTVFVLMILNNIKSLPFLIVSWGVAILFDIGVLPGRNLCLSKLLRLKYSRNRYSLLDNYNSILSRSSNTNHSNSDTPLASMSQDNDDDDDDEDDEFDEENTEPVRPLAVQILNTFNS